MEEFGGRFAHKKSNCILSKFKWYFLWPSVCLACVISSKQKAAAATRRSCGTNERVGGGSERRHEGPLAHACNLSLSLPHSVWVSLLHVAQLLKRGCTLCVCVCGVCHAQQTKQPRRCCTHFATDTRSRPD